MPEGVLKHMPNESPVPCDGRIAKLLAWRAQTLSEDERQEVEAHLAGCSACAQALQGYQEVADLMRQLPVYTLPPDLPPKLLRAWEQPESRQEAVGWRWAAHRASLLPGLSSAIEPPTPQRHATRPLHHTRWLWQSAAVLLVIVIIAFALFGLLASTRHNGPAVGSPASLPRWIPLHATGRPPAPRGPGANGAVGYDAAHNRLLFFGGVAPDMTSLNDTWVLVNADGATGAPHWMQLATVNTPAPHKGQAGAYDAASNRLIVYGGCLGQCTPLDGSVYVLTNANGLGGTPLWQQLYPSGGPPPNRTNFSAVYDAASNRLIVFGGEDALGTRYNDTWVLTHANGLGGTPAWVPLNPSDAPPARKFQAAVYLPATNQMLVFGGNSRATNWLNGLWVLSNANGLGGTPAWSELAPGSIVPAPRANAALVYDQAHNRIILYGGNSPGGSLGDTWVLTNANGQGSISQWQQLAPSGAMPAPRANAMVAYNPASQRLIVFGGGTASGAMLNDLWVLALAG
jgi:uncharacterized membrane protein YhdT